MTLKDRLNDLPPEKMRQLQCAFEQQFAQYVEVDSSHFVGVNVKPIKHLEILESVGCWSYGSIRGK